MRSTLIVTAAVMLLAGCKGPQAPFPTPMAQALARGEGIPIAADNPTLQAQCRNLFASVYSPSDIRTFIDRLAKVKITKDDFETTDAYHQRLRAELQAQGIAPDAPYYFAVPLDPEHVEYNADTQTLTVRSFAISNYGVDGVRLFSELRAAGVQVEPGYYNLSLTLAKDARTTDAYIGQNAFGASALVGVSEQWQYGIFDRPAHNRLARYESPRETVFGFDHVAFQLPMPPEQARRVKDMGNAVIAMTLKYPYFAAGKKSYNAKISTSTDKHYHYRYAIGDIQCAPLTTPQDGLITVRPTQ